MACLLVIATDSNAKSSVNFESLKKKKKKKEKKKINRLDIFSTYTLYF